MDIVIDTSVIIAVIAGEAQRDLLIERTIGADLLAPHSVHWEIGNAFSAMLRRNRVTIEQALQSMAIYKTIPIRFVDVELEESLQLAETLDIYAYDAYLIRCALKYSAPLITLDQNLITVAQQARARIIEVLP
jgi:predicted nucleic acid-binding protein